MPFNKAKALQEAEKYVLQGKFSQAIKQYLEIFQKDTSDLNLLNTIGDLYVREGNIPEAVKLFYRLADTYVQDGFNLKAIAIFRKAAKLDPNTPEPLLRLAALYLTQGWTRDARQQFLHAAEFYKKRNQNEKALEILRKTVQIDPENSSLRARLAMLCEQMGRVKDAGQAYAEAAELALRGNDPAAVELALNKALELVPKNSKAQLVRARLATARGDMLEVEKVFAGAPELKTEPGAGKLLLQAYLAANKLEEAEMLAIEALRGSGRDFTPLAALSAYSLEKGNVDAAFKPLSAVAEELIERKNAAPLVECLREIWRQAPQHIPTLELLRMVVERAGDKSLLPEVLEGLGHAYIQAADLHKAEEVYRRVLEREPQNEHYRRLLKQVLQRQGKEMPESQVEARSPIEQGAAPTSQGQLVPPSTVLPEFDLSSKSPVGTQARDPLQSAEIVGEDAPLIPPELTEEKMDLTSAAGLPAPPIPPGHHPEVDLSEEWEVVTKAGTEPPSFNFEEIREEIEYYLEKGFVVEAHNALAELEGKFPGNKQVAELRRRVEVRGKGTEAQPPTEVPPLPALPGPVPGASLLPVSAGTEGVNSPRSRLAAGPALSKPAAPPAVSEVEAPVPSPLKGAQGAQFMDQLASDVGSKLDQLMDSEESSAPPATLPRAASAEAKPVSPLSSLLDELKEDESAAAPDDPETDYNLGVAYREMGLLDEAIGELQKVVRGAENGSYAAHYLQACSLLALCFVEKKMPSVAVKWYRRALETPDLDEEATLALQYDMGAAYELAGDARTALERFIEVYSQNIDFRDVAEKVRVLQQKVL
jgi:tetratricopeptide (TPR) repeat protein